MIFVPAVLLPSSIQRWILLAFSVLSVVSPDVLTQRALDAEEGEQW